MKLHKSLAIEVQQGKMPNDPWYLYGVGGISHAGRVGGYPTKEEAQLAAVEHARNELNTALNSLPNAEAMRGGGDSQPDQKASSPSNAPTCCGSSKLISNYEKNDNPTA
jgi:hypothetical protein